MNIEGLYQIFEANPSIATDSRRLKAGDIFFALKGPNFDGNKYINQALDAGAAFCVTDDPGTKEERQVLKVGDSLQALQALARQHRLQFNIPFFAITGSNGKTTTKELVHAILSSQYCTYTTEGNLNNHIGVPLTILKIKKDAEFAVIEMGANHIGEIASYCWYTMPTHALITNCGKAHLEGFGSEAGVRIAKGELFDYIRENKGTAFLYSDLEYLVEMGKDISPTIQYGTRSENNHFSGKVDSNSSFLTVKLTSGVGFKKVVTKLVGGYNLPNVLAAIAVGKTFNVAEDNIVASLENYTPTNSRSQLIERDGNNIILDAYNANPSSMKLAIENFAQMAGKDKILILGAMRELGAGSIAEHSAIVDLINHFNWKHVVLVGEDFRTISGAHLHFSSVDEARSWYKASRLEDSSILIKGSRGLKMEKVIA